MTSKLTRRNIPATPLTFADVFSYPQYTLRGISDWDAVAKLGSKNIVALISSARSNEQSLTGQIRELKQQQSLLSGGSGDDIKEMAKEFENPTITNIGIPRGSLSQDFEPLDAYSIAREGGSTTFNMCGWCKHAGGGSCRYSYHITTTCNLLGNTSPETRFNTPCLLQGKTVAEIADQVTRIEDEIANLLARREKVREGIKLLQQMKNGAPEKPYLMSLRPCDHFNVGDEVMVYTGNWSESAGSMVKDGVWVPAIVAFGYRHHDGYVSYQALFPIHTNMSNFEGRGGGAGMSRPEVLLRSEFVYLLEGVQNNKNGDFGFIRMWLANIDDKLGGFGKKEFLRDLFTGKMASPPASWQPPTDEIPVRTVKDAERVLQMLDASLFKTADEIKRWAAMQLTCVHPDRFNGSSDDNVKSYAARQTRAVIAARALLIARL